MSTLLIEAIGPASSVQDRGRVGAQRYGLTSSGAMDRLGLAVANVLVGNAPGDAAIEIGPLPARIGAEGPPIRLALGGAARQARIGERTLAPQESFLFAEGETLTIGAAQGGAFSYLGIEGGIRGAPSFGSLSVTARAGIGSPYPRPLQNGDVVPVAEADPTRPEHRLTMQPPPAGPIRIVLGPQDDYFDAATIETFFSAEWTISLTSDRMGFRLEGPMLTHAKGFNIISDGIVNGHIQIPGNGQPLVLLADRGTTGGYPKIGAIITADLGRFAQIEAGRTVRFARIGIEEAQAEAIAFARLIERLAGRIEPVLAALSDPGALLAANVAGGAVDALDSLTWGGYLSGADGFEVQGQGTCASI